MLGWIHDHALEVQALAAIASVLLTGVLVGVTVNYVRLTKTLASAASAEAERQRQATRAQRLRFCSVVGRLEVLVGNLPESRDESRIRAALVWTDEDIDQLLALAPSMGEATAVDAESALPSLRWLARWIRYVQFVPAMIGIDWDQYIPAADWARHRTLARTALVRIDRRETPAVLQAPLS